MSSLKVKVLGSDIIKKMKRQATNWEKIFANYISDGACIQTMQRILTIQFNNSIIGKQKTHFKIGKIFYRHFTKEDK